MKKEGGVILSVAKDPLFSCTLKETADPALRSERVIFWPFGHFRGTLFTMPPTTKIENNHKLSG
jgi:hypothetical protein